MNKRAVFLSTALVLALAGMSAPVHATPPSWATAHGYHGHHGKKVREYRYVYYPAQRVYYAPETRSWFWLHGSNWQAGLTLPHHYQFSAQIGGIPVVLQSSRPYIEHVYVEERYGRPWRNTHYHDVKHRHRHKHRHDPHHWRHHHDDREWCEQHDHPRRHHYWHDNN
jgi:hypothetical protein